MKLASLISGGKDSLYSAYLMQQAGHSIDHLLGMISENPESFMFHTHNLHLLQTISQLTGIPLTIGSTKGIKEDELADLKALMATVRGKADGITTGAIASNYQKQRIDAICAELGMQSIAPFWGRDPEIVLREMLAAGFRIMIIAVAAPPLDEHWLGRIIDESCITDLVALNKRHGIHIMGEGGEYDTLVLDCPLYREAIEIDRSEKRWDPATHSGVLIIQQHSISKA